MSRLFKGIIFALVSLAGLLIIISVALYFFVNTSVYKSWIEKAASEALGMDVRVGGRLGIYIFPVLKVKLHDLRIRNRGVDIVSAQEAYLKPALLPLLKMEALISDIRLMRPVVYVKMGRDGQFNFEQRENAKGAITAAVLDGISIYNGRFFFVDERSGQCFEAENFDLSLRDLRIAGENRAEFLKKLSFKAEFACREIRTQDFILSDVKFRCNGKDGIFAFDPVKTQVFEGQGSGNIVADLARPVPHYTVSASLAKFKIEDYFKTLSSAKVAEGAMDFSAGLTMSGNTAKELKQSAEGEVSLSGENLTLYGHDLDREFARYQSSQNFNLWDVGAYFFTGPLGLAAMKGYNFANVLKGSGGSSGIGKLYSNWKIERGIAQARDVAFSTKHNRIALKGGINFAEERFEDVTIALIDAKGCAKVKQKMHGSIQKPVVEKPLFLVSLAGPALNLFKNGKELLTGGKCEVFYAGSVPAPK